MHDKCKKVVNYYIRERNTYENREPYVMFSTTYRSNIAIYISFIELESRYNKLLLDLYDTNTSFLEIQIAYSNSVEYFVKECLETSGISSSTSGTYIASIQKWIDIIEPKASHFIIHNNLAIRKLLKK